MYRKKIGFKDIENGKFTATLRGLTMPGIQMEFDLSEICTKIAELSEKLGESAAALDVEIGRRKDAEARVEQLEADLADVSGSPRDGLPSRCPEGVKCEGGMTYEDCAACFERAAEKGESE